MSPLLPLKQGREGENNKSGNEILKYQGWNIFKQTAIDPEAFKGWFLRQFIAEDLASEIIGLLSPMTLLRLPASPSGFTTWTGVFCLDQITLSVTFMA